MIKGKTKTGFSYQIDEESLNDYEMLELFADVDENPLVAPKILKSLLGEEQTKKIKDHVRTDKGRVPIEPLMAEITDILTNSKLKNSPSLPDA